uniref:Translocon-associated protein subunit delta n=1 Tax=Capra hircus TaxID=9925 RepID=A0A8C2RT41_CAPHI
MAALASLGALALLLLSGLSCCSAEACVEPQITPSYYTTSDAVISTETVFIVEISLTCKNRVQVSWSLDHKSAHAGTYEVRFFDEESYSLLRKVSVPKAPQACWREGAAHSHSCLSPAVPIPLPNSKQDGWVVTFLPDRPPQLAPCLLSFAHLFSPTTLGR